MRQTNNTNTLQPYKKILYLYKEQSLLIVMAVYIGGCKMQDVMLLHRLANFLVTLKVNISNNTQLHGGDTSVVFSTKLSRYFL